VFKVAFGDWALSALAALVVAETERFGFQAETGRTQQMVDRVVLEWGNLGCSATSGKTRGLALVLGIIWGLVWCIQMVWDGFSFWQQLPKAPVHGYCLLLLVTTDILVSFFFCKCWWFKTSILKLKFVVIGQRKIKSVSGWGTGF